MDSAVAELDLEHAATSIVPYRPDVAGANPFAFHPVTCINAGAGVITGESTETATHQVS